MGNDPYERRRGLRALYWGIGISTAYIVIRLVLYGVFPAHNIGDWALRDTMMDVPRLLGFGAALYYGAKLWGKRKLGMHWGESWLGLVLGGAIASLYLLPGLTGDQPMLNHWVFLLVLIPNSLIVGLFEETLFRGLFFGALSRYQGKLVAIWASSLFFTVYHVGAQPFSEWPIIFCMGMALGVMRAAGVGLGWLIAWHAVIDTLVMFGTRNPAAWLSALSMVGLTAVAVGGYIWMSLREKSMVELLASDSGSKSPDPLIPDWQGRTYIAKKMVEESNPSLQAIERR